MRLNSCLLFLLGFGVTLCCGCGGSGSSSEPAAQGASATDAGGSATAGDEEYAAMMAAQTESEDAGGASYDGTEADYAAMMNSSGETGTSDYPGGADYEAQMYAGGGSPGGAPRKPARPVNTAEWTPEQTVEAITEGDVKVLPLIREYGEKSVGRAPAVEQLKQWITALTAKPPAPAAGVPGSAGSYDGAYAGGSGEYEDPNMQGTMDYAGGGYSQQQRSSPKEQIATALVDALAMNGTRDAFVVVENVLKGSVELGIDKQRAEELALTTLMKNIGNHNNPARQMLQMALLTPAPVAKPAAPSAVPNAAQAGRNPGGAAPAPKPEVSLQERARQLHLSFALATMNGVIGATGPAPKPQQGYGMGGMGGDGYTGYEGGSGGPEMAAAAMQAAVPGAAARVPVMTPLQHVNLAQPEAINAIPYFWSEPLVNYAAAQLQTQPDSPESLIFAAAIPAPATRTAIREALLAHQNQPPATWIPDAVFAQYLADPAVHALIKAIPREPRPSPTANTQAAQTPTNAAAAARRRAQSSTKESDPEDLSRKEARYGWQLATEKSMLSLMNRMQQRALLPGTPGFEASEVPVALHRGAEATISSRFTLPLAEIQIPGDIQLPATTVNYVRIESTSLNQKTVLHYRNALRDKEVVDLFGGNAMWLDSAVIPNRKDGTLRFVDVLLSRNNSRPALKPAGLPGPGTPQPFAGGGEGSAPGEYSGYEAGNAGAGGGTGGVFVVEILCVEVPDFISEPQDAAVSTTR